MHAYLVKKVHARRKAIFLQQLLPELLAQVAALLWLHIVCAKALRPAPIMCWLNTPCAYNPTLPKAVVVMGFC